MQTIAFPDVAKQAETLEIAERFFDSVVLFALFDAGVFVNSILSPAVPEGMDLLRTSYMATHTDEQIDRVLAVYGEVGKKIGLIS